MKLGVVDSQYFSAKFDVDILQEFSGAFQRLESQGWLSVSDRHVRLTHKGLLRVDTLLPEFYDRPYRGARYT